MKEQWLTKLEEKIGLLAIELENLRTEVKTLRIENTNLSAHKTNYMQKLKELLSALSSVEIKEHSLMDMSLSALHGLETCAIEA